MSEENISQEFRLKNADETRNYFHEEIEQNELMCREHKKVCTTLNYISFYDYWMCFHFCFCFFDWYSNRNYKFCIWIKNLCNSFRN